MSSIPDSEQFCVTERRSHPRFEADALLRLVAGQPKAGDIEVTKIDGQVVNASASGILISLDQPIEYERIWIRIAEGDQSLSECIVVRHESREEQPYLYGVRYACAWSGAVIWKLLKSLE